MQAICATMFTGENYGFSKLLDHGKKEQRRHNKAIERLQKDRDTWFKERQQILDFINVILQKERHTEKTFKDEAMQTYHFATQHKLKSLRKYPVTSNYYHPAEIKKNGEIIIIIGSLVFLGYIMYK